MVQYKQDQIDIPPAHEVVREKSDAPYLDELHELREKEYREARKEAEKERVRYEKEQAEYQKKLDKELEKNPEYVAPRVDVVADNTVGRINQLREFAPVLPDQELDVARVDTSSDSVEKVKAQEVSKKK